MEYLDSKLSLSHDLISSNYLGFCKPENSDYVFLEQASPITILACMISLRDTNSILVLGGSECSLHADFASNPGLKVVIFTSGTTGAPKPVLRNFSELLPRITESNYEKYRWGLLFDPQKMAGLQVLLAAYYRRESLYCPPPSESLNSKILFFQKHEVNALSATPSLWRNMLQVNSITKLNLKQITLGGEKSDDGLLRELSTKFPTAKIIQIYASTELGYILSVRDHLAGIPISYFQQKDFLKVDDTGEILVARNEKWFRTGDLVELVNERYLFVGRSDSMVNIGGVKVDPLLVENSIKSIEGVLDVIVKGVKNPILGSILVAEVILGEKGILTETDIKERLGLQLDRISIPAIIKIVDNFSLNSNGKRELSK